jgi:sugar phosphate isomerase/epimerase
MSNTRKIGVMADCFRLGTLGGIARAAALGADGVQLDAGGFGAAQEKWTPAFRAEARKALQGHGLILSAVCGDLGGHGFEIEGDNPRRVEETQRIMDLAVELGCGILTTHIGCVPPDAAHKRHAVMRSALQALGRYGETIGCRLAIETGPEEPSVLGVFLADMPETVGINYDPANLWMVQHVDPVPWAGRLVRHIFHTHAKDGKFYNYAGGEKIYGFFAEGGIGDLRLSEYFEETPLGKGEVNIPAWVATLDAAGYEGFYTIEREVGESPEADIAEAIRYLRAL